MSKMSGGRRETCGTTFFSEPHRGITIDKRLEWSIYIANYRFWKLRTIH